MGFIDDVEHILGILPEKRQIALFSATMPDRIKKIARNYLQDPEIIEIKMPTATVKEITQQFLFVKPRNKKEALLRILAVEDFTSIIIFVRTKSATEELAQQLNKASHSAVALNGDITQKMREKIISQFRNKEIVILVATDVAARGLDIEHVTHVVNFDIPFDCETYVHRIGRTGRAGRSGKTILFVAPSEGRLLSQIERHTKQKIDKIAIPEDHEVQAAYKSNFCKKITARLDSKHLQEYKTLLSDFAKNNECSIEDIAASLALLANKDRSLSVSLPKIEAISRASSDRNGSDRSGSERTRYSKDRSDRNRPDRNRSDRNGSDRNRSERSRPERNRVSRNTSDQDLFRIEVGKAHGVHARHIVGAIANEANLESRDIQGLKIYDNYSTVALPKNLPQNKLKAIAKAWVCGQTLEAKLVSERG